MDLSVIGVRSNGRKVSPVPSVKGAQGETYQQKQDRQKREQAARDAWAEQECQLHGLTNVLFNKIPSGDFDMIKFVRSQIDQVILSVEAMARSKELSNGNSQPQPRKPPKAA